MTAVAINTFVTAFAFVAYRAVHSVARFLQEIGVVTVFAVITFGYQITIFQIPRRIIEVAVFHCARCVEER